MRTGVWTDFHAVNSDSIRILGRGLGVISLSPRMDVHVGVWYLDRNRIKLLPAGGVHWRPNPEWDAFLVFPNPKVRKRFVNIGSSQWWWYVAGEYGGGRWTIERDPARRRRGRRRRHRLNDIRVIGGLEWETQTQARGHIEVGYVFDREIIYDDTRLPPEFDLDDTVMVRARIRFLTSCTLSAPLLPLRRSTPSDARMPVARSVSGRLRCLRVGARGRANAVDVRAPIAAVVAVGRHARPRRHAASAAAAARPTARARHRRPRCSRRPRRPASRRLNAPQPAAAAPTADDHRRAALPRRAPAARRRRRSASPG